MKKLHLERIVINLSHDCNLRCKYCYAEAGSYRGPRGFLSLDKGKRIADYFCSVCNKIDFIQFFGGEPLLNYKVLGPLCKYILETSEKRNIKPPLFGIVTNGTILNKTILKIIQEYSIQVTISLDGLSDINDSLRVRRDGGGTFHGVAAHIKTMKQETGQPVRIEGTLTATHLHRKFSLVEFMDYVVREFGIHSIHMPWIIGDCYSGHGIAPSKRNIGQIVQMYSEAIDRSLSSLITPDLNEMILISYVERYLYRYFRTTPYGPYMCTAGNGSLAVSMDGTIYPCFMFINNRDFKLGHIDKTAGKTLTKKMYRFSEQLRVPLKSFSPTMFCPGVNYECTGSLNRIRSEEMIIFRKLKTYIQNKMKVLFKKQDTKDWIKTKLVLYNLLLGQLTHKKMLPKDR